MYPFLFPELFNYTVPMYDLLIILGVFLMLIYVAHRFEKNDGFTRQQTNRILILLVISLLFALILILIGWCVPFYSRRRTVLRFHQLSRRTDWWFRIISCPDEVFL